MYGLILNCIKWTVLTKYGEAVWKEILQLAQLKNADWNDDQSYEEHILYALANATTKVLKVTLDTVLELVGRGFIDYIAGSDYQKMIFIGGHTFMDLLQNVTTLHLHMRMGHFKDMRPPVFKIITHSPTHVSIIHKYGLSTRHSWGTVIVGLLKESVDRYYKSVKNLQIKIEKSDIDGHNELTVKWEEDDVDSDEETESESKYEYGLPPSLFAKAFPFHFVINKSLQIIQAGKSLNLIFNNILNEKVSNRFSITRPATLNWKNFRQVSKKVGNEAIVLTTLHRKGCTRKPVDIVGEFLYQRSKKIFFFVGSPHFSSIEHATQWGVSLKDFAVFDSSKDSLFIKDARTMRTNVSFSRSTSSFRDSVSIGESESVSISEVDMTKSTSTSSNSAPEKKNKSESRFDDSSSIADIINYIVKERLNLNEDCSNWINILTKNLIHTLGLLKRLPSSEPLQRMGLPILLETELAKFLSFNNLSFSEEGYSKINGNIKEKENLGVIVGLSNSTKQLLKSQWSEIISTKGNSNSLLTKFGDIFFATITKIDSLCKRIFAGTIVDQASTLMNIMQLIIIALDNPVGLMTLVKKLAVQYMIYGADSKTFQSIGMAISTAFEQTLGPENVKPNDKESWIVLTRSVGNLIVEEYKEITQGRSGQVYLKTDKKWKKYYTKLTASKLILYRDNSFKDKKDEIDLAIGLEIEKVDVDVLGDYVTNYCFSIEGLGFSKNSVPTLFCVDSEDSLSRWIEELSIRIRALMKMSSF